MPHATIDAVDVGAASTSSGVAGVYAATDLNLAPLPASGTVEGDVDGVVEGLFSREPLARDVVRFVGEIVAVVVAESAGQAVDAAELVAVEYEELPAVFDAVEALQPGAPLVHEQIVGHYEMPPNPISRASFCKASSNGFSRQ